MADEKRKSLQYSEVEKAAGKDGSPREVWEKIGMMVGIGKLPTSQDMDLTGASDSEISRIDEMLGKAEDKKDAAKDESKTRGNK